MIKQIFLGALLMLGAVLAFADGCGTPVDKWEVGGFYGLTKQEACSQMGSDWHTGDTCWNLNDPTPFRTFTLFHNVCPDNKLAVNGICKCPDPCVIRNGLDVDDGTVGPNNTKLDMNFAVNASGDYRGNTFCNGGCKAIVTAETGSVGVAIGGRYYGTFSAKEIGASCSSTPDLKQKSEVSTPKPGPEYDCIKQGKGFGYVNGSVLCTTPTAGKDTSTKSTTTPNADGSSTKTDVTKVLNCTGDGSCVTQTTTTTTTYDSSGVAGTSYTNQTVEKSSGSGASGSGSASQSSSFCKDNPQSPFCKTGSFSGACGAGAPVCDGDPVQCATAKAVFEHNCKSMSPGDPVDNEGPVGSKKVNVGSIVPDNFLPSDGSCIADKVFTIQGRQYVWKMSLLCDYAHGIRPAVIAIAWLAALYIVFGRGTSNNA